MMRAGNKLLSPQVVKTLSTRFYSQQGSSQTPSSTTKITTEKPAINSNVPGLSENCVAIKNTRPGVSKEEEYKNPEYFCYHVDSFAEAEVEMAKFRLPAPSNKVKFER